jgi:hypothetical protein
MRVTIAKGAAFKAAVFGSSLMLLGGAGYAAAQQAKTAHAPTRASVTPPPHHRKHHPKHKPSHHHKPVRHTPGKSSGKGKSHGGKHHGKTSHHVATPKTKRPHR